VEGLGCDDVCEHDTNADEVNGNGRELEDGSHDGDENEVDVADGSWLMCNIECDNICSESTCIAANYAPCANS